MDLTYFKRYRMEFSLVGHDFASVEAPAGFRFVPWNPSLLDAFAEAKYRSFRGEIDANVFPCLGELAGCRRLMGEIARKPGFIPEATWLAERRRGQGRPAELAALSREFAIRAASGAIQNLGITPAYRNCGLGTALLFQALAGSSASACGECTWK